MSWMLPGLGRITSPYGPRVLAGAVSNFHAGTDLGTKRGPVYAAQAGIVRTIWKTALGAWVVDIRHADEGGRQIRTRYIHMYRDEILVAVGQAVAAGQRIGTSGSSGTSAAHLHFEALVDGATVDPVPFMAARGVTLGVTTVSNPGTTPSAAPNAPSLTSPTPITPEDDLMSALTDTEQRRLLEAADIVRTHFMTLKVNGDRLPHIHAQADLIFAATGNITNGVLGALSGIRALAAQSGVDVDEQALAKELAPVVSAQLVPAVVAAVTDNLPDGGGVTEDQVRGAAEDAIRKVLGSLAGTAS